MTERSDPAGDGLPGHYLYRTPSVVVGVACVVVALALLGYGVSEVRRAGQSRSSLSLVSGAEKTSDVPVFRVTTDQWIINGQPVDESDLVFRLSGVAARAQGIIVEHDAGLPAEDVTRALDLVNRAGFAQVGLRTTAGDESTTGIIH